MIKINFQNNPHGDDEQLIRLLKTQSVEQPSGRLVENTLEKLKALRRESPPEYRPLKKPVYIMLLITSLFLPPFFIPNVSNDSFLEQVRQVFDSPASIIAQSFVWCWLIIVAAWIISLLFRTQYLSHIKTSNQ